VRLQCGCSVVAVTWAVLRRGRARASKRAVFVTLVDFFWHSSFCCFLPNDGKRKLSGSKNDSFNRKLEGGCRGGSEGGGRALINQYRAVRIHTHALKYTVRIHTHAPEYTPLQWECIHSKVRSSNSSLQWGCIHSKKVRSSNSSVYAANVSGRQPGRGSLKTVT